MTAEKDVFAEEKLGKSTDFSLLRKITPFISPYKAMMMLSLLFIMIITMLELAIPYITKEAIDRYIVPVNTRQEMTVAQDNGRYLSFSLEDEQIADIVTKYPGLFIVDFPEAAISYENIRRLPTNDILQLRHEDIRGVGITALLLVIIVFFNFITTFAQFMLMEYNAQEIMHDIRLKLFKHTQRLSSHFFNKNPVGRLVTRVTNDIQNMHEMLTSVVIFVIKDLFLIIGITVVLFAIDWKLAIAVYALFPVVFFAAWRFAASARESYRTLRIKTAEINSRFSETIGGIHIIQLFNQAKNNYQSFKKINHDYYNAGMRQVTVFAMFMPVIEIMSSVALALVIFYGGGRIIDSRLSLGELVLFISYVRMFFRPIRDIAEKYNITLNALSSAERIFLLLDEKDRLPEPETEATIPVPPQIERISGENVWFSYVPGEPVLKGVSFEMTAGSTLAVVGPTGSGKTSLINLLVRFYDPDTGTIKINGTDIRRFNSSHLRSKIAIVTQDPFLFSGSIRNNIFPAGARPDQDQIERILAQAQCKKLVERLPNGIETDLNERGGMLSSGQRQLISIARALASNPEIIIFDEATSYVDSETEASIQKALFHLMAERTVILIAHRLSTASFADCILVMRNGEIIESGNHEKLMHARGFYYRLVEVQA